MLKEIRDKTLTIHCGGCNKEYYDLAEGKVCKFDENFGQYENYYTTCPNCGRIEVFNMNIPVDAEEEPFWTGDLPLEEEIQRYYVRILIRLVREDFVKNEGN